MKRWVLLAFLLCLGRVGRAGELQGAIGAVGEASDWRDDSAAYASFRIGYAPWKHLSFDGQAWFGHGAIDDRLLSYFTLGASLYGHIRSVRPYLRLGLVHQHEEPSPSVRRDPFGAAFGVGDGIRHRGGFMGSLGVQVPLVVAGHHEWFLAIEGAATWFPDPRGPAWYAGGGASVGVSWSL